MSTQETPSSSGEFVSIDLEGHVFHDSSGTTVAPLGYNLRRYGDWNVTGQARPKSRRCLIVPASMATEAWRRRVSSRGHFPTLGAWGLELGGIVK